MRDPYEPAPTYTGKQAEKDLTFTLDPPSNEVQPAKISPPVLNTKARMPDNRRFYHMMNQRLAMIQAPYKTFTGYGIFTDMPIHAHRQQMRQWIGDNLEKKLEQDRQKRRRKERQEK